MLLTAGYICNSQNVGLLVAGCFLKRAQVLVGDMIRATHWTDNLVNWQIITDLRAGALK